MGLISMLFAMATNKSENTSGVGSDYFEAIPRKKQLTQCANCDATGRVDARFCHACGGQLDGAALQPLAIQVSESQRSLSLNFEQLAEAVCGSGIRWVETAQEAENLGFPDECPDMYGKLSTLCLVMDARPVLFVVSKRRTDPLDYHHPPFAGGKAEPIEIHVLDALIFDKAMTLAGEYQRQTKFAAEVVKEF